MQEVPVPLLREAGRRRCLHIIRPAGHMCRELVPRAHEHPFCAEHIQNFEHRLEVLSIAVEPYELPAHRKDAL